VFNCLESNEVLKRKFKKLHRKIVDGVNPDNIIAFLFGESVIGNSDMKELQKFRDEPQQQCTELLTLLHNSGNRQAFVYLYSAIKDDNSLQWVIEEIDEMVDPAEPQYRTKPIGNSFTHENLL